MRDIPKFTKMIINDYFVLITFLGGIASLGLSLGAYVAGDFLTEGVYIACGALFFFVLCLLKIIYIRNIFSIGIETKAEVTKVYFYRSRGTITVHYSMKGNIFFKYNCCKKSFNYKNRKGDEHNYLCSSTKRKKVCHSTHLRVN